MQSCIEAVGRELWPLRFGDMSMPHYPHLLTWTLSQQRLLRAREAVLVLPNLRRPLRVGVGLQHEDHVEIVLVEHPALPALWVSVAALLLDVMRVYSNTAPALQPAVRSMCGPVRYQELHDTLLRTQLAHKPFVDEQSALPGVVSGALGADIDDPSLRVLVLALMRQVSALQRA